MHKVSIIIPCYNEEENIAACLNSVFNINYPKDSYEVILVDNGSTDKTLALVAPYPVRILQDKIRNVSGLRNIGADFATGDILAFVDADCIVEKNWLIKAQKYFDNQNVVLWGSPPVVPENATWVQKTWLLVRQKEFKIQEVEWLESMNMFVKKELFDEINGFNETLITAEDVDFSYRISKKGMIISDASITVIHTGEAKDIKEFIKKEIWRGSTNLKGIKSHGLSVKEIPSLMLPIFYGVLLPAILAVSIFLKSVSLLLVFFVFYFCPVFAIMIKIRKKNHSLSKDEFINLFLIIQVYYLARAFSIYQLK